MTTAVAVRTALARRLAPPRAEPPAVAPPTPQPPPGAPPAPGPAALPPPPLAPGDRGPVLIGRSRRCDFVIADASVSRRHALLLKGDEGWTVYDLGSTNGTRINGWRVGRAALRPGDELELGASRFRFAD